jgi:hypothetical protein
MEQTFVKLSDLTKDEVIAQEEKGLIVAVPCRFLRSFSKKSKTEQVSITVKLHDPQLSQVRLTNGGKFITSAFFHKILTSYNANYKDEKGYDVNEWNRKVRVRFVKGNFKNMDGEYRSLEVIFSKGNHLVHFFDYDQIQLLDTLALQKKYSPIWIDRPDAIDAVEFDGVTDFE